jgi:hypothetical protein
LAMRGPRLTVRIEELRWTERLTLLRADELE